MLMLADRVRKKKDGDEMLRKRSEWPKCKHYLGRRAKKIMICGRLVVQFTTTASIIEKDKKEVSNFSHLG